MKSQNIDSFEPKTALWWCNDADTRYQRSIFKFITDIGASFRLSLKSDALFQRIVGLICDALHLHHAILHLTDDCSTSSIQTIHSTNAPCDLLHIRATVGITPEQGTYLHQHPIRIEHFTTVCNNMAQRIRMSYFISSPSSFLQHLYCSSPVPDEEQHVQHTPSVWHSLDLIAIPLLGAANVPLGFLLLGVPKDTVSLTVATTELLELFVNQLAIVVEGVRSYEEVKRSSEERNVLLEVGRALSSPEALLDIQVVYQTIYEQLKRVMEVDAFFATHYYQEHDTMMIDYLMDEGILYPPEDYEYIPGWVQMLLKREETAHVFSTREAYLDFIVTDGTTAKPYNEYIGSKRPSQSLLFVPLYYGEETIGLLSAQSYRPYAYSKRHVEIFKEIAIQAGIAIANARLYAQLRSALKQAQESEQLKNHFLMTASHELRTPLTAIQGYLELLTNFESTLDIAIKKRFTSSARRACEELILLLNNVMDTGHIDQHESITPTIVPVYIMDTIQFVLEILEPRIARDGRLIEVAVSEGQCVWADNLRLRQVLLNLIGNALKYTPMHTKIVVSAEAMTWNALLARIPSTMQAAQASSSTPATSPFVVISVRDRGRGIQAADQVRLFEKFVRLADAEKSGQLGSGLGLYLCKKLTEAMKGYIWLESSGRDGEGSTFLIAFPQCTVQAEEE